MIKDQRYAVGALLVTLAILAHQTGVLDVKTVAELVLVLLTTMVALFTKPPGSGDGSSTQ